ncbi:hypothetical protein ElyMa_006498700 [Elysia marginata]|uniref:Uncharacterized protein n=1 Tax=Elysia marginata TaxID=1093978 RepID=A0AAV4I2T5_9GAST|nr:hypothetical protein ElyMa_006498700 [Elysia marginata]
MSSLLNLLGHGRSNRWSVHVSNLDILDRLSSLGRHRWSVVGSFKRKLSKKINKTLKQNTEVRDGQAESNRDHKKREMGTQTPLTTPYSKAYSKMRPCRMRQQPPRTFQEMYVIED